MPDILGWGRRCETMAGGKIWSRHSHVLWTHWKAHLQPGGWKASVESDVCGGWLRWDPAPEHLYTNCCVFWNTHNRYMLSTN